MSADFYTYLRSKFTDIDSAKKFYREWSTNGGQEIPGFGMISLRAMACHISNVLEGKEEDNEPGFTNYIYTKYGSEIYLS